MQGFAAGGACRSQLLNGVLVPFDLRWRKSEHNIDVDWHSVREAQHHTRHWRGVLCAGARAISIPFLWQDMVTDGVLG